MEIIAEIGQNHNGELSLAFELIHAAKESGADVAKFQLYNARTLFSEDGNEWFKYNCETEIKQDQLYMLAEECRKVKIEFMASAFDIERVGWLEDIGVKRYKIASRSINDVDLLQAVAETGKPIIASLGMWEEKQFPRIGSSSRTYYLYCLSKYPTPLFECKLASVDFTKYSGFSDHTVGISAAIVAFSRGAQIIEKHFTLDKSMYGPDHMCSMIPDELTALHKFCIDIAYCL